MTTTGSAGTAWHGALFDGAFRPSPATVPVISPATGEILDTVGAAEPADLDRAVHSALAAQNDWAARTYDKRQTVLLRAAQLLSENPERIASWLVAEAGSGRGKAAFEVGLVVNELRECAALASHPYGEMLRSSKPRFSVAAPSAGRRGGRDFAVQLPEHSVHAFDRTRARAR